jgi:hypothetical protein
MSLGSLTGAVYPVWATHMHELARRASVNDE